MVHDDGGGRLLRFQLPIFSQVDANLLRLQQREELALIFQVGTRGISEGIARATVFLMEQIGDARRIVAGYAQFFSHLFVQQFGERLGSFDAEAV